MEEDISHSEARSQGLPRLRWRGSSSDNWTRLDRCVSQAWRRDHRTSRPSCGLLGKPFMTHAGTKSKHPVPDPLALTAGCGQAGRFPFMSRLRGFTAAMISSRASSARSVLIKLYCLQKLWLSLQTDEGSGADQLCCSGVNVKDLCSCIQGHWSSDWDSFSSVDRNCHRKGIGLLLRTFSIWRED